MFSDKDLMGERRGQCQKCTCSQLQRKVGDADCRCGHTTASHLSTRGSTLSSDFGPKTVDVVRGPAHPKGPVPTCKLPGCNAPCTYDFLMVKYYDYCSREHGRQHLHGDDKCRLYECPNSVAPGRNQRTGEPFHYCCNEHAVANRQRRERPGKSQEVSPKPSPGEHVPIPPPPTGASPAPAFSQPQPSRTSLGVSRDTSLRQTQPTRASTDENAFGISRSDSTLGYSQPQQQPSYSQQQSSYSQPQQQSSYSQSSYSSQRTDPYSQTPGYQRPDPYGRYPVGPINMPIQTVPPTVPPHTINFYNRGEPFYEFTNFFERVIPIDDKEWPTSEHFFQAGKFPDRPDLQEKIRTLPTPRDAFQFARQHDQFKRKDWEQAKNDIMYRAVSHKFVAHPDLAELLMATGTARLVEHTVNDNCWGDGGDGSGENRLGQMLEKIRGQLFERNGRTPVQAAPAPPPPPVQQQQLPYNMYQGSPQYPAQGQQQMPQGQMPQGQMPQQQMPQGQMSQGQMPQQQMPQGQMPQAQGSPSYPSAPQSQTPSVPSPRMQGQMPGPTLQPPGYSQYPPTTQGMPGPQSRTQPFPPLRR